MGRTAHKRVVPISGNPQRWILPFRSGKKNYEDVGALPYALEHDSGFAGDRMYKPVRVEEDGSITVASTDLHSVEYDRYSRKSVLAAIRELKNRRHNPAAVGAPVDAAAIASSFTSALALTTDPAFEHGDAETRAALITAHERGAVEPASYSGTRPNPLTPAQEAIYRAALSADAVFQAALVREYGKRAGDMRYRTRQLPPHLQQLSAEKQRADAIWNAEMRRSNPRQGNPEPAAAGLFETFHGYPPEHVTEIAEEVHYHSNLAQLGSLVSLTVETESGYSCVIKFPKSGTRNEVRLASNETGTSMYFVGGDQELDLGALHMRGSKNEKDLMVVGRVKEIEYFTTKEQDGMTPTIYFHKSREGLTADGTKHAIVADVDPVLLYDTKSKLISLAGGQYTVEEPGIVG